ncbi:hypothetical protein QTP88_018405 [Uroleucon formosanum]
MHLVKINEVLTPDISRGNVFGEMGKSRLMMFEKIDEDFITFIDPHKENFDALNTESKLSDEVLGKTVLKIMKKLGLVLKNCVGISTDGCSVMSSKICGAVRTIQNEIPGAFWCPCYNHSLNLSIVKGCQIQSIRNAFGQIKEIVNFFNSSSKRNFVLKSCLHATLNSLCETCWIERHTAVLQFLTGLPKILDSLNDIANWDEHESSSNAKLLYNSIDCEFIITLYVTSLIFSITLPLSTILQKKCFDKQFANDAIKTRYRFYFKITLSKCETNFQGIFLKASKQMEDLHIPILKPRTVKKQINKVNYSIDSVEDYFCVAIYNPFLDFIINDINDRFTEETLSIFSLGIFISQVPMSQSLEYSEYNLRIIWKQFGNVEEMSKRIVNEEDFII